MDSPKPAYTVRESRRARHVRITLSARDGLVIVVPRGFDKSRIPAILEQKKRWLEKAQRRIGEQQPPVELAPAESLPVRVALLGIGEEWAVDYRPTESSCVTAIERAGRRLVLSGDAGSVDACRAALGRWLNRKGHEHLKPWLEKLAAEHGFEFNRILIRAQRTRWGSCSSRKTISLNARLLFLPEDLIRYALVHELCHTKRLDHSQKFWALVKQYEPDCRARDKELRAARRYVPAWVESRRRPRKK
jgi:predicted metal-dependent hydrolase